MIFQGLQMLDAKKYLFFISQLTLELKAKQVNKSNHQYHYANYQVIPIHALQNLLNLSHKLQRNQI